MRKRRTQEEIEDKETGESATKLKYEALERSLKEPVLKEFPRWESEKRYIAQATKGLKDIKQEFREAIGQIDLEELFPLTLSSDSPNYESLKSIVEIVESVPENLRLASQKFDSLVDSKIVGIQKTTTVWQPAFATKKRQYEKALEEVGEIDLRKAQANLRDLRRRLDHFEAKARELNALKRRIRQLQDERKKLLDNLGDARRERFEKRKAKAKQWEDAFKGHIKVEVEQCGNLREYIGKLRELAKGAMLREPDLGTIARSIDPTLLTTLVNQDRADSIAERAGIKRENARKLVDMLRSRQIAELLELETIPVPDFPTIKYEVEPGREKALYELSVGQKGTVIISLALLEGQSPLVIDQPEEPLDTLSIYDQVVGTLRRQKDQRQFVFTTHNANVAVAADADLNYVLDATADKGTVKSSGGVDHLQTNQLLLLHLEGGADAFRLRSSKYVR